MPSCQARPSGRGPDGTRRRAPQRAGVDHLDEQLAAGAQLGGAQDIRARSRHGEGHLVPCGPVDGPEIPIRDMTRFEATVATRARMTPDVSCASWVTRPLPGSLTRVHEARSVECQSTGRATPLTTDWPPTRKPSVVAMTACGWPPLRALARIHVRPSVEVQTRPHAVRHEADGDPAKRRHGHVERDGAAAAAAVSPRSRSIPSRNATPPHPEARRDPCRGAGPPSRSIRRAAVATPYANESAKPGPSVTDTMPDAGRRRDRVGWRDRQG